LEWFTIGWSGSLRYCLDFFWICLHLPALEYVAKEGHRKHVEFALLRLDEEAVLQEPLKNSTDMLFVFC